MSYTRCSPVGLIILLAAPAFAAPAPPSIEALRDEARAMLLVQQVLGWYTATVGEPSIQAETYAGHEALLSAASVQQVAAARAAAPEGDERRALGFFKAYLASELLGRHLAHFGDEVQNAELQSTVSLPWEKAKVPYKQIDILMANEKDASRRAAMERERARIWQTTINPLLLKKEAEAQTLARSLGYRSYVALAEEARLVDLKALIREGERFQKATDPIYQQLLGELAQKSLGLKVTELHRADLLRLRKAPQLERFFPRELLIPALQSFLAGIGLDLSTAKGTQIRIDDSLTPQKEPRASCTAIRVPEDVRVTVKPTGGADDFVTFFHEGGHALHYANTVSPRWEFQQLGPYALTEGLAEFFGHVWDDPQWLARYRTFVSAWNHAHGTRYPLMSDADVREMVRVRVFDELYYLRRYAGAKLIYEAALHGGERALWQAVYPGQTADLMALYRDLFGRAYGFPLGEEDTQRYLVDVDDLFYSADYTRAFGLAHTIHEALRQRFGADWYGNKEVGPFLRKSLFAEGNKLQPDEVAQLLGYKNFDLVPAEQRLGRLMKAR